MAEEEQPKSPFENVCKRLRVNHNLIMLKVTLFVMYGGECKLSYIRIDADLSVIFLPIYVFS